MNHLDLLLLATQPQKERDSNDLIAMWIEKFGNKPDLPIDALEPLARRRLAYLISATRNFSEMEIHPEWVVFEKNQEWLGLSLPEETLFLGDPEPNPADALAKKWGFTRGIRIAMLLQIVRYGCC